jgi:hypothetical protein
VFIDYRGKKSSFEGENSRVGAMTYASNQYISYLRLKLSNPLILLLMARSAHGSWWLGALIATLGQICLTR